MSPVPSQSSSQVLLREVTEGDLPTLFEHQLDPEATHMAAFPARDREAFMAHWIKILTDETCVTRAILVDGRVAGNVGSWEQDGRREIGYWIGREFWGRGVATEALSAFLELVRTRPLFAHVAKRNFGSIRVLEKCGFAVSGEDRVPFGDPGEEVEELIYELPANEPNESPREAP